jgi:hypothetical protein
MIWITDRERKKEKGEKAVMSAIHYMRVCYSSNGSLTTQ